MDREITPYMPTRDTVGRTDPPRIHTGRLLCALLQDGRSWRGRRIAVGSDFLVVVCGEETLTKASVEGR
jgi:hypothetical protein